MDADNAAPRSLPEQLKHLAEFAMTPSLPVFVAGALVVLLVPLLLHIIITRKSRYAELPSVLLLGPSGAGKTSLVTLLERRGPSPAPTHTSQVVHAVELAIAADDDDHDHHHHHHGEPIRKTAAGGPDYRQDLDATEAIAKKFLLVDTPGHGKLRGTSMARLAQLAGITTSDDKQAKKVAAADTSKFKGVIFVADAASLADPDALSATAAYLYDVLLALQKRRASGRSSRHAGAVPVLIAANKLDLFTALPPALVRSHLEAELARIRRTRSKGLLDSGVGTDELGAGDEEQDDWLGSYGAEKFTFDQMREFDIEVEIVGGNVIGKGPGVDKWWAWIAEQL